MNDSTGTLKTQAIKSRANSRMPAMFLFASLNKRSIGTSEIF
jgi:hypothetical protein